MYNSQNQWVSGRCLSYGFLRFRKRNVTEIKFASILRWGKGNTLLSPAERANINHCTTHVKSKQKLKSKLYYDGQAVGQSVLVPVTHLRPATNFLTYLWLFLDSCLFVDVGRPLWREVGSVVFSFCRASPAQSFSDLSPMGLTSIFYCLYFSDSSNLEGQAPVFISPRVVCLISIHIITWYIYSSYIYNTYIMLLFVQARTADYVLSRVVQVATQF
jgi:hypothetical protein